MDNPEKFDAADLQEVSGDKTLFRKPFKVYENFRNVYKGVRKSRGSSSVTTAMQYDVTTTSDDRMLTDNYVGSLSNDDSGSSDIGIADNGVIVVSVNALNSLEASQDCGSASPRSDGNTTDDSGIDSICDRLVNDTQKQDQDRKKSTPKSAFAAFALDDHYEPVKSSPSTKAKSVFHDTYGSLKRHTAMMDPWRRDFVLMQATTATGKLKKGSSKEDLLLKASSSETVELTSVRSKVKETVQALETKYGKTGEPATVSPQSPIYSTINRANKKNKRLVEEQKDEPGGDTSPKISLANMRLPVEEEVTDISEITQLLSNTNELLNRSSHLRASLTVSVRHANKKTGQTATFLFPAKKKEGGCKKSKAKKQGLWNNLLKKSREDLSVESDAENSSSCDSSDANEPVVERVPERTASKYEEANARIAAKFEKSRESETLSQQQQQPSEIKSTATSSDDDFDRDDIRGDSGDDDDDKLEAAATPFVRHNPARRAVGPGAAVDIRRSIRLAPKTVANLASKFDNLLVSDGTSVKAAPVPAASGAPETGKTEKELKLCKKDISKIIDALNKLEDDAKKSSVTSSKSAPVAKPRVSVVTSSRFTTSANVRKSLRMKHGMSLAAKPGSVKAGSELTKKNSVRRPHREPEMSSVNIDVDPQPEKAAEERKVEPSSPPPPPKQPTRISPIAAQVYSSKDEITNKMLNAKSILSSVELPSETAQMNKSLSLTDRYLKKLASLAEGNSSSGNFRTPQPTPVTKPDQSSLEIVNEKSKEILSGSYPSKVKAEGSVCSYEEVGPSSLRYLDLIGYPDTKKALNTSFADLSGSRRSMASAYDDVKPPSVHTYLSIADKDGSNEQLRRSVSEDNLSLRYDPVDISFLVTARPAIVREDQMDSLSYVYDDVGPASIYGQDGPGLYESIAGSILNLARSKMGYDAASVENLYASLTKGAAAKSGSKLETVSGHQEDGADSLSGAGPHEVLSYTLAKWSAAHWSETRHLSSARSSNRSSERKSIISDRSDEWIDLEEEEDYENSAAANIVQNFSRLVNFGLFVT